VKRTVREIRPEPVKPFEVRFETPASEQAQVDLARFEVEFTDEPGVRRIVWLFSMVLGCSRLIWARFVVHQDLQTVLRCNIAALEAIGGVPHEILYDRMKTAVIGEDADGLVIYNRSLVDLARHYGFQPRGLPGPIAPRPRAKSSGRSATSARTSSSVARSAISMISTFSSGTGSTRLPMSGSTRPRTALLMTPLPKKKPYLQTLPLAPYRAVLKLERRVSHEGMVSVAGNLYSVPDTTRRRILDVQVYADRPGWRDDGQRPVEVERAAPGAARSRQSCRASRTGQWLPSILLSKAATKPVSIRRIGRLRRLRANA
jgi:hypothetical protein